VTPAAGPVPAPAPAPVPAPAAPSGGRPAAMRFIMVAVLIDMLAVGIIVPVLPALVGQFTASPAEQTGWYGAIAFTYAAASFVAAPLLALRAEAMVERASAMRAPASDSVPPPHAARFRINARAPSARPMSCRLGICCLLKGRSWPVGFTQIAPPGSCEVRLKKSLSKSWLFVTDR